MPWGAADIAVEEGMLGEGVFGPFDDTEVKDDCESPFELADEAMELTRGDDALGEYAAVGCGNGSGGSFSVTYGGAQLQEHRSMVYRRFPGLADMISVVNPALRLRERLGEKQTQLNSPGVGALYHEANTTSKNSRLSRNRDTRNQEFDRLIGHGDLGELDPIRKVF
ncbi:hypothetical protein NPX13_g5642 [Xylaria arbuscula]|uniref:Uncharacterized protein n=1 Tax=Xylaria arbuscula TaxID=114810 RepID=A0A9W8TL44_9PEZI|nr:hypothetical protein NPX13_g5642 [Xylaria arbuscula]